MSEVYGNRLSTFRESFVDGRFLWALPEWVEIIRVAPSIKSSLSIAEIVTAPIKSAKPGKRYNSLFCYINMAFKHIKGPALLEWFPRAASVTMTINQALNWNGSGAVTAATAAGTRIAGILQQAVASTDSDFATASVLVPVILPTEDDEFEVDLTGATFATTYIGNRCDLNTALLVDLSATSHNQVTVLRQGSSTSKAIVKINGAYTYFNAA